MRIELYATLTKWAVCDSTARRVEVVSARATAVLSYEYRFSVEWHMQLMQSLAANFCCTDASNCARVRAPARRRRPAAAADAADRRLHVDLDAVDARRRQRAVQLAVELVERRAVVGDDTGAEERHRVPPVRGSTV